MRTLKFCFFHQRSRELHRLRRERPEAKLHIPLLEDANAIQMAIQQVAEAVAEERIDNKRAGLLLFAFQTAACNLKNVDFEPKQLRESFEPDEQLSPILQLFAEELGLLEKDAEETPAPNAPPQVPPKSPASAPSNESAAAVAAG
jgi:hypothetical protein